MRTEQLRVLGSSVAVHLTDGDGPTVVLCHGNSSSSRSFGHQLEGALGKTHRLVAMDWPGHGDSGRAADAEATYTLAGYARVLVAVTRQLELVHAVYVGWSLGGHVVLEAADALPQAAGFLIMGTPPLATGADAARAFKPSPALGVAFRAESSAAEIHAYLAAHFGPPTPIPPSFIEDFDRTDGVSRAVLGASVARNDFRDEVAIVRALTRPLAILHGELDHFVSRAYFDEVACPTLWRGAVQDLAGVGHTPQWEAPIAFDELVRDFANECAMRS